MFLLCFILLTTHTHKNVKRNRTCKSKTLSGKFELSLSLNLSVSLTTLTTLCYCNFNHHGLEQKYYRHIFTSGKRNHVYTTEGPLQSLQKNACVQSKIKILIFQITPPMCWNCTWQQAKTKNTPQRKLHRWQWLYCGLFTAYIGIKI